MGCSVTEGWRASGLGPQTSALPAPGILRVLEPKWRTARSRIRQERDGIGGKLLLLLLVGGGFWSGTYVLMERVLRYLKATPEVGPLIASKILGVALLSFLSLLLLSNLITALSSFFLARDLDLLLSAPIDWLRLYLAKLGENMLHSSWMVVVMAVPVFTAYGVVFDGGPLFAFVAAAALLPLLVVPAALGAATTTILVNVFPARRIRDLLTIIAVLAAAAFVLALRLARPEQLARPEGFRSLVDFLTVLQAPTSPLLPSQWAADMMMNWLTRVADPLPIVLLWTTAAALVVGGAWVHQRLYTNGFTRAQEGGDTRGAARTQAPIVTLLLSPLKPQQRELLLKDMRVFFRDSTQWGQLILIAVLLVVYLFNISALPLNTGERLPLFVTVMVIFLNLGLTGFVLASIAVRFIFPAVSLEGRQLWLLRSSPLDMRGLIRSKYWTGTLPLLILAVVLMILTSVSLKAPPAVIALSVGTIICITAALGAIALGYGAVYPQFETENVAQIPTSFGGLVCMMTIVGLLGLIIAIEAGPVADYIRLQQAGEPGGTTALMVGLGIVAAVCAVATWLPLRVAMRKLEQMDFEP
jgi:ABC-2 type transport system permease protein